MRVSLSIFASVVAFPYLSHSSLLLIWLVFAKRVYPSRSKPHKNTCTTRVIELKAP